MDYKNNKLNYLTEIKSIQNIIIVHITRHATDVTVCNRDLPASERSPFRLQNTVFCMAKDDRYKINCYFCIVKTAV